MVAYSKNEMIPIEQSAEVAMDRTCAFFFCLPQLLLGDSPLHRAQRLLVYATDYPNLLTKKISVEFSQCTQLAPLTLTAEESVASEA